MDVKQIDVQPTDGLPEVEVVPHTDVDIRAPSKGASARPMSAASVRSTTSTSSVATKRSQSTLLSKYTVDSYFSFREGAFESAVSDCTKNAVTKEDGQLLGSWLLREIDQWDCEKEKLVMLTEKSLIVVRYDFVQNHMYKQKKWDLKNITTVKAGDLVYPFSSLMPARDHGGVRLICGKEEDAGFFARWNFSGAHTMPYWTFAHHKLIHLPGQEDNAIYNVDDFHDAVVQQLQEIYRTQNPGKSLQNLEEPITIYTYLSLTSAIYNQSSLGFSKDRSGINW